MQAKTATLGTANTHIDIQSGPPHSHKMALWFLPSMKHPEPENQDKESEKCEQSSVHKICLFWYISFITCFEFHYMFQELKTTPP